jgi:hypothetical protein
VILGLQIFRKLTQAGQAQRSEVRREMAAHPDRWPLVEGQIGNLREWGVYEYDYIVRNKGNRMSVQSVARDPRGRITICYKDGVLGVALRKPTGRTRTEDSMTAFQSMYVARA